MVVSGRNAALSSRYFGLRVMTATPCVAREAFGASSAVLNTSARPSVENTAMFCSSVRTSSARSGLLSQYAPVSRLRFVLVA